MGLFSDYVIYIKFNDGDWGYFVRISGDNVVYNRSASNAKKYSTRVGANYDIGYYLSDFEHIISYTRVESY